MTASDAAIRARRAVSNTAIAARDATAIVAVMLPDISVAVAGGPVLLGKAAQRAAFAEQFADRAFRGYVRTPETIVLHAADTRATERGRWVGRWQHGLRTEEMRGTYVAEWQLLHDVWMLHSEIYT